MCGTMYGTTLDMLNYSLTSFSSIMSKSLLAVKFNHK